MTSVVVFEDDPDKAAKIKRNVEREFAKRGCKVDVKSYLTDWGTNAINEAKKEEAQFWMVDIGSDTRWKESAKLEAWTEEKLRKRSQEFPEFARILDKSKSAGLEIKDRPGIGVLLIAETQNKKTGENNNIRCRLFSGLIPQDLVPFFSHLIQQTETMLGGEILLEKNLLLRPDFKNENVKKAWDELANIIIPEGQPAVTRRRIWKNWALWGWSVGIAIALVATYFGYRAQLIDVKVEQLDAYVQVAGKGAFPLDQVPRRFTDEYVVTALGTGSGQFCVMVLGPDGEVWCEKPQPWKRGFSIKLFGPDSVNRPSGPGLLGLTVFVSRDAQDPASKHLPDVKKYWQEVVVQHKNGGKPGCWKTDGLRLVPLYKADNPSAALTNLNLVLSAMEKKDGLDGVRLYSFTLE